MNTRMCVLLALALYLAGSPLAAGVLVPPVLVLPPENRTGKAELDWMSTSISRYLTNTLLPLLNVASVAPSRRAAGFESVQIPERGGISRATMIRLASELKASYVLLGSYGLTPEGDLQVLVMPYDATRQALEPATSVKGRPSELVSIENTIGYNLVRQYFADPESLKTQILGRDGGIPFDAYEYFMRGMSAADETKKLAYLAKAISACPDYAEAAFERGRHLYARRDYAGTIKQLARPTDEYADRFAFLQGMAYYSKGDFARAASIFTGLLARPALSVEALNNLAAAASEQGNHEQAAFYMKSAVQEDSTSEDLRYNLGVVLQRKGAAEEAMAAFKEAATLNPSDWRAQLLLAELLSQSSHREESEAVRRMATARAPAKLPEAQELLKLRLMSYPDGAEHPDDTAPPAASREEVIRFHLDRGAEFCKKGSWIEAVDELKRVLYLNPYHGEARYLLASAYYGLGDLEHAMIEAKMSLWNGETAAVHVLLGRVLNRMGKLQESRREAERALRIDPNNADARAMLEGPGEAGSGGT